MKPTIKTVNGLSRREFLIMTSLSAAGLASGCAANPVTGKSQLMLMSEQQEISIDRTQSPHQFSADYGPARDRALNQYINRMGKVLTRQTHRPQMPYSFRCVNAVYINAYAFPGGSIACTRGILLSLNNEAELAALLGHELGHVNARHTAHIMSKNMLASAIVGGLSTYAGTLGAGYGELASKLGMIGSGALLASYSRDNERQADELGMAYTVKSGYNPNGMVGLMEMLNRMNRHKTSAAQMLFATHPMSSERYQTAISQARTTYQAQKSRPFYAERYMDHTAGIRKIKNAIETLQKGETAMAKKQYTAAETLFATALKQAPGDYTGLLLMAKCKLVQKKNKEAGVYAEKAKQAYPDEAQGYHISGFAHIRNKKYDAALADFSIYERRLPGNPNTLFFKGLSLEGMEQVENAAKQYHGYLQKVQQGTQAQYAYKRLVEWGYIKP